MSNTLTMSLALEWTEDGHALVVDIGPARHTVAHVMDGDVHIYWWHDPEGDDKTVTLAYRSEKHGRAMVRSLFATCGCAVPPFGGDEGDR